MTTPERDTPLGDVKGGKEAFIQAVQVLLRLPGETIYSFTRRTTQAEQESIDWFEEHGGALNAVKIAAVGSFEFASARSNLFKLEQGLIFVKLFAEVNPAIDNLRRDMVEALREFAVGTGQRGSGNHLLEVGLHLAKGLERHSDMPPALRRAFKSQGCSRKSEAQALSMIQCVDTAAGASELLPSPLLATSLEQSRYLEATLGIDAAVTDPERLERVLSWLRDQTVDTMFCHGLGPALASLVGVYMTSIHIEMPSTSTWYNNRQQQNAAAAGAVDGLQANQGLSDMRFDQAEVILKPGLRSLAKDKGFLKGNKQARRVQWAEVMKLAQQIPNPNRRYKTGTTTPESFKVTACKGFGKLRRMVTGQKNSATLGQLLFHNVAEDIVRFSGVDRHGIRYHCFVEFQGYTREAIGVRGGLETLVPYARWLEYDGRPIANLEDEEYGENAVVEFAHLDAVAVQRTASD